MPQSNQSPVAAKKASAKKTAAKKPRSEKAAKKAAEAEKAAKLREDQAASEKAEADAKKRDEEIAKAAQSGKILNRVRGPGPMMTEEGVKAPGETFRCSKSRTAAYGDRVEPVSEDEEEAEA